MVGGDYLTILDGGSRPSMVWMVGADTAYFYSLLILTKDTLGSLGAQSRSQFYYCLDLIHILINSF